MQTGELFRNYNIGPQVGQGGYGKIFVVRDNETGLVYALKHESNTADRKTLRFETQVLKRIQGYPYFPQIFDFGLRNQGCWCIMELCGPSLEKIRSTLPNRKFSLSTGLRASEFVLKALHDLHNCGFIHRDIKPSNVLIRLRQNCPPLCLIDFGLSRLIRDPKTGKPVPARQSAGFRGTKSYASIHAHNNQDLSRRDDMISWFYFTADILLGSLPWKGRGEEEVICLKQNWDIEQAFFPISTKFTGIWNDISSLEYGDEPHYQQYLEIFQQIYAEKGISMSDPYDWEPIVSEYTRNLAEEFGVTLRIGGSEVNEMTFRQELGLPPSLMKLNTPLLRSTSNVQSFTSVMDLSEINEGKENNKCSC